MADLFDRFVGSAGALTGHAPDAPSAQTWGPSGTNKALDGSGSVYPPYPMAASGDYAAISSWSPPGADYAVAIVFGAGFRQAAITGCGPSIRATGSDDNDFDYYVASLTSGTTDTLTVAHLTNVSGTVTAPFLDGPHNLATQIAAGDTLTLAVSGSAPPQLTVYQNGVQIYQATDSGTPVITAAGSAGLHMSSGSTIGSTDVIRTIWAGATVNAIGGPEVLTIAPTAPSVALSGTQSFTVSTAFTDEGFTWAAVHGSYSAGTLATEVYTAPSSGSSDVAGATSIDLPTRSAIADITLTTPSPTPTPTPTGTPSRGGMGALRRAKMIEAMRAETLPKPAKVPPLSFVPPTPRVLKPMNVAPPERPAISDAKPSKAKLDFPMGGRR